MKGAILDELAESFEDNSRIEYIRRCDANGGRIPMLEIGASGCDMPFSLVEQINNNPRIATYNVYGSSVDGDPRPIWVISESKEEKQ